MVLRLNPKTILADYGVVTLTAILFVAFSFLSPQFLTLTNLNIMAQSRVAVGFFAIASLVPLIADDFDISLGYMMGLVMIIGAKIAGMGLTIPQVIVCMLLIGIFCGAFNGFVTVILNVPSTVSTLGSGFIFYGFSLYFTGGRAITGTIPSEVIAFMKTKILAFNISVWVLLFCIAVMFYIMEFTPLGRYIYAVGMSQKVAELSGVRVKLVRFSCFLLAGIYVAIASVVLLMQVGSAYVDTGPSYLMPGLAVVFLSMTTYHIGRFNVVGVFASLFMLGILFDGISLLGAPFWVESVVNGLILVAVVIGTGLIRNRHAREK